MINTFLCVHDFVLIKDMIDQVHAQKGIMMAGVSTELPKNTMVFHGKQIDVLVLDCTRHCAEALLLSRQIYEDEKLHMRIIYLFKEILPETIGYLLQREKDPSYMQTPFTLEELLQQIAQEGPMRTLYPISYKSEESFASQIMQNMGLPVHLYGFAYIKSSAMLLYETHTGIQLTMKQIYKEVARMHETTASRVEKSIRTAIDYAYRIAPQLIGIQGIKPTNSQLIHLICERVLLHELDKREAVRMSKAMYIHVPFCRDICAYCDFTRCRYHDRVAQQWLQRVITDIENCTKEELQTVYIGGGTPSTLDAKQLQMLCLPIRPHLQHIQEFTVEVNADSLSDEKIAILVDAGVNRISMGAQTFDHQLLKRIQRKADYAMIKERIMALHQAGITNISLDLLYGLPGQTMAIWQRDLALAVQLPITHISLYSLTIEEHSQFGREGVQPCEEELESDMFETAIQYLEAHGFAHYETSNFAKAGKRSLHNQMYWHYEDFYGIGCGASGKQGHQRYDNTRNLHTYIMQGASPTWISLNETEEMFEMLMMNLRLQEGLSLAAFEARFHRSLWDVYGMVIENLKERGYLVIENGYLHTTYRGMMLLNEVLLEFL